MISDAFNKTHLRALEFLPSDGSWADKPKRGISPAINSLLLYHSDIVERAHGTFGPRGGFITRYRLTPAGVAKKAELNALPFHIASVIEP